MKKILFSLSVIAAAAAVITGGTLAFFSDTETSTGNTFTAGTLDLTPTTSGTDTGGTGKYTVTAGGNGVNGNVVFSKMAPGESGTISWALTNAGNTDGYIDFEKVSTFATFTLGATPEPEPETSASGNDTTNGDLDSYLGVNLSRTEGAVTTYLLGDVGKYVAASGLEIALTNVKDSLLVAGNTATYTLSWSIASDIKGAGPDGFLGTADDTPEVDDNIIQGDTMGIDITFELGQTSGQ